jgi:pimeloyl-ACP methyl ester carboxylesterase
VAAIQAPTLLVYGDADAVAPSELWGERLAGLWRRLPPNARRAVIEQYARLIARA